MVRNEEENIITDENVFNICKYVLCNFMPIKSEKLSEKDDLLENINYQS